MAVVSDGVDWKERFREASLLTGFHREEFSFQVPYFNAIVGRHPDSKGIPTNEQYRTATLTLLARFRYLRAEEQAGWREGGKDAQRLRFNRLIGRDDNDRSRPTIDQYEEAANLLEEMLEEDQNG